MIKRIKFKEDGITKNGERVTVRAIVHDGDITQALIGDTSSSQKIVPVKGEIHIVYEDEDVLVIDKQAGVPVHPCPGHYDSTIGNFLAWRYQNAKEPFVLRGVLNRLDKGTSGLMVAAKNAHAGQLLTKALHTPDFIREYLGHLRGPF